LHCSAEVQAVGPGLVAAGPEVLPSLVVPDEPQATAERTATAAR
jgi:hypothetical protein